ncbi:hypothetical protein LTR53_008272 [Teratosphaeriaceae sp. CCFEE 6253]|nr:hypothetical protein LTR53_008272 [Teratosphaeriaceae sp. CCFEE 6253]
MTLSAAQYVAAKVCTRTPPNATNRERILYDRLGGMTTAHQGSLSIRSVLDDFNLVRQNGAEHVCLVHPPLQCTLFAFQRLGGRAVPLPEALAKVFMRGLLEALDFLHTEASATHCDCENAEKNTPSERKLIDEERSIYVSRPFRRPRGHAYGDVVLCDFGEARIGSSKPWANIQPEVYKAPEILMQFERYDHAIDVWNAGCVLWDMLEVDHLFVGEGEEGQHNNRLHMREIVNLSGEPSSEFLRRSPHSWRLFDELGKATETTYTAARSLLTPNTQGNWKAEPPLAASSLATRIKHTPEQSRAQTLDILSYMLRWLPEDRWTARDLLEHPWLKEH